MNDYGFAPIIRIEIDGMKHAILRALGEQAIVTDASVRNAIDSFPWEKEIETRVHQAIQDLLKVSIDSAVYRLRNNVSAKVEDQIRKVLKESVR